MSGKSDLKKFLMCLHMIDQLNEIELDAFIKWVDKELGTQKP